MLCPVSALESQYAAFESAGLVVIYSCEALASEAKRKLRGLAGDRFFDLSGLQLPGESPTPCGKLFRVFNRFAQKSSAASACGF